MAIDAHDMLHVNEARFMKNYSFLGLKCSLSVMAIPDLLVENLKLTNVVFSNVLEDDFHLFKRAQKVASNNLWTILVKILGLRKNVFFEIYDIINR